MSSPRIYFDVQGTGEPVLLIPGLGSDVGTWATFLPAIRDRYQLILIENRGSARSPKPPGPYSTEIMADDAAQILSELGISRAHVIGKSMGGMIAQVLAAKYPEKVHSLVLACTLMEHDAYGEELLSLGRVVAAKAGLYETYRLSFLLSYSKEYCMTNRSRLEEAERLLARIGSQELLHGYLQQSLACERHNGRPYVKQIQAPSLILAAKNDWITTADHARKLATEITGAELVLFDHGRHGFWREYPNEVNPIVSQFLQRHPL